VRRPPIPIHDPKRSSAASKTRSAASRRAISVKCFGSRPLVPPWEVKKQPDVPDNWSVAAPARCSLECAHLPGVSCLVFFLEQRKQVSLSRRDVDYVLGPLASSHADDLAYYLASIVESSDDGIISIDLDGIITSWNRGAEQVYGYTAEETIGKPVLMLIPSNRHDEGPAILERIKRGEHVEHYETVRQRKQGQLIDVSLTVSPIRNAQGKIIGASKVSRDITERRRAQDHQQFLMRELEHRAKNLFAVILSVINRTLVEGQTLAGTKEALTSRVMALAEAHAILSEAAWRGAPLAKIIKRNCAGFTKRLDVRGCDIILSTPAAHQFALALHELATNAAKYGALSIPGGRVSIECDVKRTNGDGTFSFVWKEAGGPPVSAPNRKGFGNVILVDGAKQFASHVALNYEPEGLRYELRCALSAIEAVNTAL
jgi:two-component system, chemotaxis family, CheB/CheR fusion protein